MGRNKQFTLGCTFVTYCAQGVIAGHLPIALLTRTLCRSRKCDDRQYYLCALVRPLWLLMLQPYRGEAPSQSTIASADYTLPLLAADAPGSLS